MRNLFMILIVFTVSLSSQAQDKKSKNAKYNFDVNGNCEQCKKRIEKAAYSVAGVKSVDWNIDDHSLQLILNEQKSSVLDVKKAVANVGHDTDEVKASDEVYKNLHSCCLYDRD